MAALLAAGIDVELFSQYALPGERVRAEAFAACRDLDQLRVTVCYTDLNVKIGGLHVGEASALTLDAFYAKFEEIRQHTGLEKLILARIPDYLGWLKRLGFNLTKGRKIAAVPPDADVIERARVEREQYRLALEPLPGVVDVIGAVCQPLTAPAVRPRTSCFWLNQPRIRIGAIAMVEAALSLA